MKAIFASIAVIWMSTASFAQLKGSGKTVTKTFDYQNFDKVFFEDLDGKLEIEVGKDFGISITIDDNLLNLLSVVEHSGEKTLTVSLKGNRNNKMYIEDTQIKIKITMPFLMEVSNDGNSGLRVSNLNNKYCKSTNPANGSTTLSGIVDQLEISCSGNGNLSAENLIAKNAKVTCRGNGSAKVNVSEVLQRSTSGNGNISNIGKAKNQLR
ncbi:MAG: DUF2807 domain-containing protein [Burkholderiales bacterium]|nr:DUF2807 domain-containing protein [Flavobacterium sp.]